MSDSPYVQYRRTAIAEMMPWTPDVDMSRVSVSAPDREAGSPKAGDMIARNPANHEDKWLVAAAYFAANFEPLSASPAIPIDVLEEVREALEPFVKAADKTNERCIDSVRLSRDRPCDELTVGDLRRAKSALARLDELMEKME